MNRDSHHPALRGGLTFHHAARSGLGRITGAGWLTHGGMAGWRDLGHHAVALVVEGRGIYQDVNGHTQALGAGSLILSFAGLRHYYRPLPGSQWTEFFLMFDGPVFDLWEQQGLVGRSTPVVQVRAPEHWARQLESVLGASGQLGADPPLLEVCRLQAVLAELLWQGTGLAADEQDFDWAARARSMLESARHHGVEIEAVASRLGMTAQAFRKKFVRLVGESPAHYRSARLIDRACQLMQTTKLLDKQISEQLGFCDEYYFSRRFRQVTGKSPREFRSSLPQGSPPAAVAGEYRNT